MRLLLLPIVICSIAFSAFAQQRPGVRMAEAPQAPQVMKMSVEDGRVTADIRGVLLRDVLAELAARTGIVFELPAYDESQVALSLYGVPLQQAVQRIVGDGNNAIVHYGDGPANAIQFVRISPRNRGGQQQASLLYIGDGAITKTKDDTVDTPEQALKALVESPDAELRQKAVAVLVAAKSPGAVDALTAALKDPAPEVRGAAVEGLAGLNAQSALPQILLLLKDRQPSVRQSAIDAVSLLGDAGNVKQLRPLTRDKDPAVAAAADLAIAKLALRKP
jgi:hypothetical protein